MADRRHVYFRRMVIEPEPGQAERWQWYCPICRWGETARDQEAAARGAERHIEAEHNDGSPCPIVGPHTCDRAEHIDGEVSP
jgi:hypothetical protein